MENYWIQGKDGKKEQVGGIKQGVRKEQVDKKYHNLFDAYDVNKDGTLEENELDLVTKGLSSFAGADKTLDANENTRLASIFAQETGIENADFMGFVKSVSDASAEILSTTQTTTSDGGKQIVTSYKDGTIETIAYYPNGEYKFKHTEKHEETTTTTYSAAGKQYTADELDKKIREIYNKKVQTFKKAQAQQSKDSTRLNVNPGSYKDYKKMFMQKYNIVSNTNTSKIDIDNVELSELAKQDVAVRDFVLSHFIETHKMTQENLDTMGILDDIGAAINAGAGELFNACKNIYNKYFGNGTKEDYKNFYELAKKFEPNYDKALCAEGDLEMMRQHPDKYFTEFGKDIKNYSIQKGATFQQKTEQYQQAQVLKNRIELLKKARFEVEQYQNEQDALVHGGAASDGLNPASHIVNANNLLLQCFDNDQEAVNLLLNGSLSGNEGNAASAAQIQALIDETEKANAAVLGGKTFDEIKGEYNQQYKEMYGVDFVPDELNDKINDAKATGGMVKIAAITVVSILITKSPVMANIMGVAAGSEAATGAGAAFIRTLVSKYGQTVVQQGIKFAMTTGTLATDIGLTLLNQVTDNREGVQWDEVGEAAKSSAKYIYFGAYVGSPLAQAVSQKIGNLGLAGKLMTGGAKTTQGAITTTTISGEKLVQNFMNTSKSLLAKGGALATEIGAFSGLEIATGDVDPTKVVGEQAEMLTQLKLMNNVLEYMLGGKVHTAVSKANMEAAIEKSGVKNWTIKEIKTPNGTQYMVEAGGAQIGRFDNANDLASAMMGKVSMALKDVQGKNADVKAQATEGEKQTPKVKVETDGFNISIDEAMAQLSNILKNKGSIIDIRKSLEVLKNSESTENFKISDWNLSFYAKTTKTSYKVSFDRNGNIWRYTKSTLGHTNFYSYDASGKIQEGQMNFNETRCTTLPVDNAGYIIQNSKIPNDIVKIILKHDYAFTKENIDAMVSLVKSPNDWNIVKKMLLTKGNSKLWKRAVAKTLRIAEEQFTADDIVNVLKSDQAKQYVAECAKKGSYCDKEKLVELIGLQKIAVKKYSETQDLSYKIQEISLDGRSDAATEYKTNEVFRAKIDSKIPEGETVNINGKLFCRTTDGLLSVKLSQETFEKLFPTEERFNIKQGNIGDCWLISNMEGIMATPDGRAALYSCFTERNGLIYVKLPNSNIEVAFDVNKWSNFKTNGVDASYGIKMLEQTLGFTLGKSSEKPEIIYADNKQKINEALNTLDGGNEAIGWTYFVSKSDNQPLMFYDVQANEQLKSENEHKSDVETLLSEMEDFLHSNPNALCPIAFKKEFRIDGYTIYGNHACRLVGYDKNTRMVKIVNPHDGNKIADIPFHIFVRNVMSMYAVDLSIGGNNNDGQYQFSDRKLDKQIYL